jgi:cytochrome c551
MNKKWIVFCGLALVLTVVACSKNAPAPSSSAGPTSSAGNQGGTAVNAQAVYKQNCVTCHGVNLEGGAGPNLQKAGARLKADQISAKITNGGGGMPPFKGTLKDNEINALAEWLAAKK